MSPIIANAKPISPLRRRMIEDMTVRGFGEKTQSDYIRHVKNFTIFLGRSPDTATPEDVRAYQLSQREAGVQPPTMNATTAALRFFFTTTCGQSETIRHLRIVNRRPTLMLWTAPEPPSRANRGSGEDDGDVNMGAGHDHTADDWARSREERLSGSHHR